MWVEARAYKSKDTHSIASPQKDQKGEKRKRIGQIGA